MLLSLPRELRDEIYALVFETGPTEDTTIVCFGEDGAFDLCLPAIMLTCKQLYWEAQPPFFYSLKFIVSDDVAVSSMQQSFSKMFKACTVQDIRTIVVTCLGIFRTASPSQRRLELDIQKGMPWGPRRQISPTIYFTGSDPFLDDAPNTLQYLLSLPCLQHIEIALPIKRCPDDEDRAQWGQQHYYDLNCLTTMLTLKTVTINLNLNRAIRWKLYKRCLKELEKGCLKRFDQITKETLEDAYGLRSWLEEGFRKNGLDVEVRCICHKADPYSEVQQPLATKDKEYITSTQNESDARE
jgi:hypothetical protein